MSPKTRLSDKLLYSITGWLRCRIIRGNRGEPYLERYHLFRLPGGGGAYIHRFLSSDPDRGLHDHPWNRALGIVLSGGYLEQRKTGDGVVERILGAGSVNRLTGEDFHRIVLPHKHQAWTLFMHSAKVRDWGFVTRDENQRETFTPHNQVNDEGSHDSWWKTADRGRQAPREPLDITIT
jgi:hypothetical protein